MVEGFAQDARHLGETLEMVRTGPLGCHQHEDEIDRLAVERIEIDRLLEACANRPTSRSRPSNLPCGMAIPPPISGGPQPLALQQRVEHDPRRQAGDQFGLLGDLLQGALSWSQAARRA